MSNDEDIEEMKIECPKKYKKSKKVKAVLEDEIIEEIKIKHSKKGKKSKKVRAILEEDEIIEEMKLLSIDNIDVTILNIFEKINKNKDKRIILLRDLEVLRWIFNDMSFLKGKNQKELKKLEDRWGFDKLKNKYSNLPEKQWSNSFGEYIAQELCILQNKNYECQKKTTLPDRKTFKLDIEVEDSMIEVKTGTRYTQGTAHEKIAGVPFKYRNVPTLYKKPLKILCIGKAEDYAISTGLIQSKNTDRTALEYLKFCKENYNITFVSIRDELLNLN